MVVALGLFFNMDSFLDYTLLTILIFSMYIRVFFTIGFMSKDSPTTTDFLFRDGQAYFGSQEGKRNEMIHGVLEEEKAQTGLLRSMADRH